MKICQSGKQLLLRSLVYVYDLDIHSRAARLENNYEIHNLKIS